MISEGVDKRTIAFSVLKELSPFGWDAMAIPVLVSFANRGLWMMAQMNSATSPALQAQEHNDFYRV